jgi:ribosomal protein L11 methyltransferase
MTLHRVDIDVPDLDSARSVGGVLAELIEPAPEAVSVFEHGAPAQRVSAYFAAMPELAAVRAMLASALTPALASVAARTLCLTEVPDENWVAISQAALPPVVAGRFTVHGSHDRYRVSRGHNAIEIDAGEAFGTAHHATTLGCLMAIDETTRRRPYRKVLDLGCGTGVLAIAAARALPQARVVASDIDPQATAVAAANVRQNALPLGRLRVLTADALTHPLLRGQRHDLIVANILANPLIALAKAIARISPRRGTLVLSGLLVAQAPEVTAAYRAAGFALVGHCRIAGWSTLTLVKR